MAWATTPYDRDGLTMGYGLRYCVNEDGRTRFCVYAILKTKGYNVSSVQNPTTSLADDVAATNRTISVQDGPVVLVGHSYGGVVITEAGNNSKVAKLVYITAFAPDSGESVASLIKNPAPGGRYRRSCHRKTDFFFSIARSSQRRSQPM